MANGQRTNHKGAGKQKTAMDHNRRYGNRNGTGHNGKGHNATHGRNMAAGRNGPFTNSINAWNTRSDLAVWSIPYTVTAGGFVLGGSDSILLADGYELDPGDTIVSVGGIDCVESTLELPEMVDQAYEGGNLVVVVREAKSGKMIEVELLD